MTKMPDMKAWKMAPSWALSLAVFALLSYRGGLMKWQQALAVAALGGLVGFKSFPLASLQGPMKLVLAFLGFLLPSVLASPDRSVSLSMACALFLAFLTWSLLRREAGAAEEGISRILYAWVAFFCAVIAARIAWLAAVGQGLAAPIDAIRPFFPNQNLFAGSMIVPAIFLCARELAEGRSRMLARACLGILFAFLLYAGSKGAWMAFMAGSLWVLLRISRTAPRKFLFSGFAVLLLLLIGVASLPVSGLSHRFKAQASAEGADPNAYFRGAIWAASLKLGAQRPFQGWGLGMFQDAVRRTDFPSPPDPRFPLARYRLLATHAHQEYLQLFAEAGMLPLLALLAGLAWLLALWLKSPAEPRLLSYEGPLVAMAAHALVDFNFHSSAVLLLAVLLLALRHPFEGPSMALSRFKQALAALPLVLLAGTTAANFLKKTEAYPASPARIRLAALLSPLDPQPQLDLAARSAGQDGALKRTRRALDLADENAPVLLRAARLFEETAAAPASPEAARERLDWALQALLQAAQIRPFDIRMQRELLSFYLRHGSRAEAEIQAGKCIEVEPNDAFAWEWKARFLERAGRKREFAHALGRLKEIQALGFEADDPYSHYLRQADWAWVEASLARLARPTSKGNPG